ncbi:hypothetical protein [Enterococcus alishanensis]
MKESIPYREVSEKDKSKYLIEEKCFDIVVTIFISSFILFLVYWIHLSVSITWVTNSLIVLSTLISVITLYVLVATIRKKYVFKEGYLIRLKIRLTKKQYLKDKIKFLRCSKKFWFIQITNLFFILESISKYILKTFLCGLFYSLIGWMVLIFYTDGKINLGNESDYLLILQSVGMVGFTILLLGMIGVFVVRRKWNCKLTNASQQIIALFILLQFSSIKQFLTFVDTKLVSTFLFILLSYLVLKGFFNLLIRKIKKDAFKEKNIEKIFSTLKNEIVPIYDFEESQAFCTIKPDEEWIHFIEIQEINKNQLFYSMGEGHGLEGLIMNQQSIFSQVEIVYKIKYSPITIDFNSGNRIISEAVSATQVNVLIDDRKEGGSN